MNSTKLFFFLVLVGASITLFAATQSESASQQKGRFLAGIRAVQTCDRYPRVCSASGSPGPDCCSKKCVNVSSDAANCGKCGKRCKYGEICCRGRCVNPFTDEKNCGSCYHKCIKGSQCVRGMCSYA